MIMLFPFLRGFGLGASLIIAIGAQNAFVLRQGLRREQALFVASICTACDALLIMLGAAGFGSLIAHFPLLPRIASLGGALFLIVYGFQAFLRAVRPSALDTASAPMPRGSIAVTTLSVSLLNPHVYLDTVVLVGGLAGQYTSLPRLVFAMGAIFASALWFFSLALGAGHLAPLFRRPIAWQVLDWLVGLVMWAIGYSLLQPIL